MPSRAPVWIAALLLAAIATTTLLPAVGFLVGADPRAGGVDLQSRQHEVSLLLDGVAPGSTGRTAAVYPPASYVLLGPIAVVAYDTLKWIWALTALGLLAWLGSALARRGHEVLIPLAFAAPFAFHGVAYGIQNGQLHVHATAAVAFGILLLVQRDGSLRTDLLGAALLQFALVKPTVAAPFVLLLLTLPGRRRPLVLVVVGYLLATGIGLALIGDGLQPLAKWLEQAQLGVEYGAGGSYGNLHSLSEWLGWQRANATLSMIAVGGLGLWALSLPADDDPDRLWMRLGLVAVFARLFAYHQDYDDALLILTLGGLLVVARRGRWVTPARWLAAAILVVQLPPRGWLDLGSGSPGWLGSLRVALWLAAAALLWRSQRPRYRAPGTGEERRGGERAIGGQAAA